MGDGSQIPGDWSGVARGERERNRFTCMSAIPAAPLPTASRSAGRAVPLGAGFPHRPFMPRPGARCARTPLTPLPGGRAALDATGLTLVEQNTLLIGEKSANRLSGLPPDPHELALKIPDLVQDRLRGPLVDRLRRGKRTQARPFFTELVLDGKRPLGRLEPDGAHRFPLFIRQARKGSMAFAGTPPAGRFMWSGRGRSLGLRCGGEGRGQDQRHGQGGQCEADPPG